MKLIHYFVPSIATYGAILNKLKTVKAIEIMPTIGIYHPLGGIDYFKPYPLPPKDPPLAFSEGMMVLYGEASFALGQLNEMSRRLPDTKRFIKACVIKEAFLSSAIEGIHTTFMDLFTHPVAPSTLEKKVQLVLNDTKARHLGH